LSLLRNYTHNHLLSRDSNHSASTSGATSPSSSHNHSHFANSNALTRSVSYTPMTTNADLSSNNSVSIANANSTGPQTQTQAQTAVSQSQRPTGESGDVVREDPSALSDLDGIALQTHTQTLTQTAPNDPLQALFTMTRSRVASTSDAPAAATAPAAPASDSVPSIRFSAYYDPRSIRPSLSFPAMTRILPTGTEVIRVGRYSERDTQVSSSLPSNAPSSSPVGFKSKVVSRRHCEFWHEDGKWYIRDVKSSSGTFLNHIRLSPPSQESKAFPVNDGDIIQLGIDFKGGEEMIFRCVKIRVECNRGWQQGLNNFNKQTHQRLRALAKNKKQVTSDSASTHTSECAICLMSVAPCQSLFVAPCSHVWHYKCIRPILNGPTWPNFLCPNCRAVADLEEDVEDMGDFGDWEGDEEVANGDTTTHADAEQADRHVTPRASVAPMNTSEATNFDLGDLGQHMTNMSLNGTESTNGTTQQPLPETPDRQITPPSSSVTQPVNINVSGANEYTGLCPVYPTTSDGLAPDRVHEGPMTPRNDIGPFVLDGSAGRNGSSFLHNSELPSSSSDSDTNGHARSNSGAPSLPPVRFD
jgi:pSer/pThr/pTyr-binding forkhead associated (FHA) protein